jgi:hypothetical protein
MKIGMVRILIAFTLFAVSVVFSGCGYLIAGGAGAAGGYILKDKGYEVQSPVKKENEN